MSTSCACYTCFPVSPEWITALWQGCKITKNTAEQEYVKCKKNIRAYIDNVSYHTQYVRSEAVAERKAAAVQQLQPLMREAIRIEVVESEFLPQFTRPSFRRKFLVLSGPTQVGKTVYARSLFGHEATLELNCSGVLQPDLRAFDPLRHKCIIFDEGSTAMVLAQKKLFQGPAEEVALGHSATNMYAYNVFVYGVAMVVTSNTWPEEMASLRPCDRDWIEGNSVCVRCMSLLYKL
jgi:hypothetical protein